MMKSVLLLAAVCLSLCGCASVQLVDDNAPSIVLKEKQTRNLVGLGSVSVPAGVYAPDFTANNGIYYRAPTHIVFKSMGMSNVERGGIFIPNVLTEADKEKLAKEQLKR